jgi:hypothetical protein
MYEKRRGKEIGNQHEHGIACTACKANFCQRKKKKKRKKPPEKC